MAVNPADLSELSEQVLVESCHAGNTEAFDRIVRRYQPSLLAHARRRLGSQQAAEDAVQETLLRAYRAMPRFNGEYRLGNWLHRILRNVCVDESNRRRRRMALVERLLSTDPPCAHEAVEQIVVGRDSSDVVRALDELPESYRQAFVLRAVEELPYDEVAAACGITEDNARARVSRARTVLRRTTARFGAFVSIIGVGFRRGDRGAASTAVAPSASSASSAATSASSTVLGGPSPLTLQVATTVHEFGQAGGFAAGRALAVLASAAVVVIPAALAPSDDGRDEARAPRREAVETADVASPVTAGTVVLVDETQPVAPETTASTEAPRPPLAQTARFSAFDLGISADGSGWTIGGRIVIDTGTEVLEGTVEPYSTLAVAPADPDAPGARRDFVATVFVSLDHGRGLTFRLSGSAVLVEEAGAPVDVPAEDPAPPADPTAPPADPAAPPADPTAPPADPSVDPAASGGSEDPNARPEPPPTTTTSTTTSTTATTTQPAPPTTSPASVIGRFDLSGVFVLEGAEEIGLPPGGGFGGAFTVGETGGSLVLRFTRVDA